MLPSQNILDALPQFMQSWKRGTQTIQDLVDWGNEPLYGKQQNLIAAPELTLPRREGYLTSDTNAFDKLTGCVVMLDQLDGAKKLLGY